MKAEYAGNLNDLHKYTLLRALAGAGDIQIGICWMLTPPTGRTATGGGAFLSQPNRWRVHDPAVFDTLEMIKDEPGAVRLKRIEESGLVPGARFFTEPLPEDEEGRAAYFRRAATHLAGCELVFLDPDKGLDVPSMKKGWRGASAYLYRDELVEAYQAGHSVLVYQHFPREDHHRFLERVGQSLEGLLFGTRLFAFEASQVVFLLAVHPRHTALFERRLPEAAERLSGMLSLVDLRRGAD